MHRYILILCVLFAGLMAGWSVQVASSQQSSQQVHLSEPGTLEVTSDLPLVTTMDGLTNRVVIEAMATEPPVATPEPTLAPTIEPTEAVTPEPTPEAAAGYYVDCWANTDNDNGRSPQTAWKTLEKVNDLDLAPGEALYFKRDCTWNDQLELDHDGTAANPIIIGVYGEGSAPAFRQSNGPSIQVSGSHQVIEGLTAVHERGDYPTTDTRGDCTIPQGWRVGIVVNGDDNVLREITATQNSVGVFFQDSSERNVLTESRLVENEYDPNSSIGPTGVLLHGTGNEVSHSFFSGNQGACSPPGTAFEIYKAYDSWIHHNTVMFDRKFAEMGVSSDTIIEYNKMYNHFTLGGNGSQGIVTRGHDAKFGPVTNTTVRYNTFVFANPDDASKAAILNCSSCGPDILHAHHNILVSATRAAWVGGSINEHDNVWWDPHTNGAPKIQGFEPTNPIIVDPQLADPANGDFSLHPNSSPAAGYGAQP